MKEEAKEKTATAHKRAYVKPVIVVNTLVEARGTCRTNAGTCPGASTLKNAGGGNACRVAL